MNIAIQLMKVIIKKSNLEFVLFKIINDNFTDYACVLSFLEITEYAKKIGIDVVNEKHLLHIAQQGIVEKLPHEWKPW